MFDLKEQLISWKELCSKDNTSGSRGFYLAMAIGFIVLAVFCIALFVASCIGALAGGLRIAGFVAPVIWVVLVFAFIFACSRGE